MLLLHYLAIVLPLKYCKGRKRQGGWNFKVTPLFNIEISLAAYVQSEVLEELLAVCATEAQLLETKFPMYTTCLQIPSAFMASDAWTLLPQAALPPDVYHVML